MINAISAAVAFIAVSGIASEAFHAWLRLRERERMSDTDKAELLKRLEDVDAKLRELRNTVSATRTR